MISGLNHLTISVSDLARSIEFYHGMLGLKLEARWKQGAYLSAGDLWLCLSQGDVAPAADYTHYAFSVAESAFKECSAVLDKKDVKRWKTNSSEGDSIYFLDPDGHRLELHAGNLQSRLASLRSSPYEELQLY